MQQVQDGAPGAGPGLVAGLQLSSTAPNHCARTAERVGVQGRGATPCTRGHAEDTPPVLTWEEAQGLDQGRCWGMAATV